MSKYAEEKGENAMANQEHLEKLREGVEAWNQWRVKNPRVQPDLREASLMVAQLQGANFIRAQLQGAQFNGAQLQGAYFTEAQAQGANFIRAQLRGANFQRAQLQRAFFIEAQVQEANFNGAQLQGVSFPDAQLQGANFKEAQLQGAVLAGAFFDNTTSLKGIVLEDETYGGISLVDINWGGANLAVVDWPPLKILLEENWACQEDQIFQRSYLYGLAARAYRQLAAALRGQGLNEDADRFAYRAQVLQRKMFWEQKKFGRWFFSRFLALVAGYGYRMERILLTYALVVSLFAVGYFVLGMFYNSHLSFLDAMLTSVTAFHGRVFSEPFSHPGELWLTAFEAVAGLVIEGVFIAMLTQRFLGR
jgi:uncharacterized protein YjbI with pentapeptide repeats